jgi:hypothetical protein
MKFIIDTYTKGKGALISKLKKLKTTVSCEDGGEYYQDRSLSQIHIETSWKEDELNEWLWKSKNINYIGVVEIS